MAEQDPVANFLKSEEEAFKELDDDFGAQASQPQAAAADGGINFDDFDQPAAAPPSENNVESAADQFNQMNGDFSSDVEPKVNGGGGLVNGSSHAAAADDDASFNSHGSAKPREEPATIKKWREDEAKYLKAQDEKEAKESEAWRADAKKKLAELLKEHDAQVAKNKKKNRDDEKEAIKQRDATTPGKQWDRITQLCEFNDKKAAKTSTKDTTRMRDIMLQMKHEEK